MGKKILLQERSMSSVVVNWQIDKIAFVVLPYNDKIALKNSIFS